MSEDRPSFRLLSIRASLPGTVARAGAAGYSRAKRGAGAMNGRAIIIFWVLGALVFIGLFLWVGPLPPSRLTLATGAAGGGYEATAETLKKILARSGVTVELVRTQGSDDKLARLTTTGPDAIDAAIMQGGNPDAANKPGVANLGALFLEPIWLFARRLPP